MTQPTYKADPIIAPACLTACFLFASSRTMGLSFGDDSWYLQGGTSLKASDFLYFQYWEPLYSLWFKLLAYACPHPVSRYFLSWGILVVLIAMIPPLLKLPGAAIYSFIIVVVPFLTVGPFIALFAAMIALCGICFILRRERQLSEILTIACVTCFILGFCRAEFDYGVFLAAIATLIALLAERRAASGGPQFGFTRRAPAILLAATVLALAATMLFIMGHSVMQRSGGAFAQHFNIRAAERGILHDGADAWKSDYAEKTFGVDPGHNAAVGTATLGDFFRANPALFLGHVWRNLLDARTIVFVVLFVVILTGPWVLRQDRFLRLASIFLLVLGLPPLMGIFVIYPRSHYAIILAPSLTLFAVQWMRPQRWLKPRLPWLLGAGVLLIWLVDIKLQHHRYGAVSEERVNLMRVQCMRSVDAVAQPMNPAVFDAVSVREIYYFRPRTPRGPGELSTWSDFEQWTKQSRPAWVSVDPSLGCVTVSPLSSWIVTCAMTWATRSTTVLSGPDSIFTLPITRKSLCGSTDHSWGGVAAFSAASVALS